MAIPELLRTSDILPCPVLGLLLAGTLQVRLAANEEDIRAAQAVRYRVFVEEMGAQVSAEMHAAKRDWDHFDAYCDHLLVVDHKGDVPRIVGTYRLLRREAMRKCGTFYTAGEFNIQAMEAHPGEIMELGRSCVSPEYRSRAAMQLLWRGIGAYVARYKVEIMFGCASLAGADPAAHAQALAYLYHYHLAPPELRLLALPELHVKMDIMPKESVDAQAAFIALPALIKGYLRLGGYVGDGAVIDKSYNTTDVGVVVKTDLVTAKYAQRYAQDSV